jgi:tetratricopeptide (TPR) repeat protein
MKAAAAAAAPGAEAAVPLAWMADIAARKLYGAGPEEQQRLYGQADELARDALSRNDDESRALVVLGRLARLQQRPSQTSVPAAHRAIGAGNALFGQERFEDAQRRYEEASRIQPELAEPVKLAGNCQYAIAQDTGSAAHYSAAEQLFRRAIELDPQDAQAHHFLADTYLEESKTPEALAAACASIAANPAYYPAWQVVRTIRASQQRPLRSFRIRPLAFVSRDQGGKPTINVSTRVSNRHEAAAWMVYAAVKAGLVGAAPEETGSPAFGAELRALRAVAQEFAGQNFQEPPGTSATESAVVLRKLFEMDEKGDLPTAILLLAYNESFRDDLEALKRARPDACADFVHRYDLRPF